MMVPRQDAQVALFHEFSLDEDVPQDHLLRSIDWFVDLSISYAKKCIRTWHTAGSAASS